MKKCETNSGLILAAILFAPIAFVTPTSAACLTDVLQLFSPTYKTELDAIRWLEARNYHSYTTAEKDALDRYGHASSVNRLLRVRAGVMRTHGKPFDWGPFLASPEAKQLDRQIKHLDSAIARQPIDREIEVYRYVYNDDALLRWEDPIGKSVVDPAFVSTSLGPYKNPETMEERVVYKIRLPEGFPAATLWDKSHEMKPLQGEKELLLPRQIEFTIKQKFVDKNGIRTIELEPKLGLRQK
jgi:hypothetical protein